MSPGVWLGLNTGEACIWAQHSVGEEWQCQGVHYRHVGFECLCAGPCPWESRVWTWGPREQPFLVKHAPD